MVAEKENRTDGSDNTKATSVAELMKLNKELKEHEQKRNAYSTEITPISEVEEREPEWLVTDYIPRGGLTMLAGTGGDGKTTIWCAIAAAISTGKQTFLESCAGIPFDENRKPEKVLCFSSEDSFECVLRRRLRVNGANLDNIFHIPIRDDRFREIMFDSELLRDLIHEHKPSLCIFDPIQAFVPPHIHMSDRNAMRSCLEPLIAYGERYGTSFLITVHTNKREGASGRDRIADTADIWDISRSILIAGITNEDNLRYVSHEKSNYGLLAETALYSIKDEVITPEGFSAKKDRDFVEERRQQKNETKSAPVRDEVKKFILEYLEGGEVEVSDLDEAAKAMSISRSTLQRAKTELKKEGCVKYTKKSEGKGKGVQWFICAVPKETAGSESIEEKSSE